MPPRNRNANSNGRAPTAPAESREVARRGARDVEVSTKSKNRNFTSYMDRPSTKRAIELRSRMMGGGEIVSNKIRLPGREKLDLLAGDLMRSGLQTTFSLKECIKSAQAHMDHYLDDIKIMEDPTLCYDILEQELKNHTMPLIESKNKKTKVKTDLDDPAWVTKEINTSIHNRYMLASAWQIVANELEGLQTLGLPDKATRLQVQTSQSFKSSFITIYKMVKIVVELQQHCLRSVARYSPHFKKYFSEAKSSPNEIDPQISFNMAEEMKAAYKSYVDSIALELCLPDSQYPFPVLYQCLRDTETEAPTELKRFPQAMWDAVGDMANAVKILDYVDVFLSESGKVTIDENLEMPASFKQWEAAQEVSREARMTLQGYTEYFSPFNTLKNNHKKVIEMWKCINDIYKQVGGKTLDDLWCVVEAKKRPGHWTNRFEYFSRLHNGLEDDINADGRELDGTGERRAITANGEGGEDEDEYADMPELVVASDSSDDDFEDSSDEESEADSDAEYDSDDYDSEDEEELRTAHKAAMDLIAESLIAADQKEAAEKLAKGGKSNPFLKLFEHMRGRMFSASSTLKTRKFDSPSQERLAGVGKGKTAAPGAEGVDGAGKSTKATVEEVPDPDATAPSSSKDKKKKKKPKKKKSNKTSTSGAEAAAEAEDEDEEPEPEPEPETPVVTAPTTPQKGKKPPTQSSPVKSPAPAAPKPTGVYGGSTATLPLPQEQNAQSARSYLAQNLNEPKVKTKTRPDHATSFLPNNKNGQAKDDDASTLVEDKPSVFSGLKRRTTEYVRRLLGKGSPQEKGSLKWEQFLQIMREMGFKHDPSTAGSSVRFDPPDPKDRSIMFHKPHPDPTLTPVLLKKFRNKLQKQYDWVADDIF